MGLQRSERVDKRNSAALGHISEGCREFRYLSVILGICWGRANHKSWYAPRGSSIQNIGQIQTRAGQRKLSPHVGTAQRNDEPIIGFRQPAAINLGLPASEED